MQISIKSATAVLGLMAVSACSELGIESDVERVAVGAGAGCVAGEIYRDGRCVEGAILGGAIGALLDTRSRGRGRYYGGDDEDDDD